MTGADESRPYFLRCRCWQHFNLKRLSDPDDVIYPMEELQEAGTSTLLAWNQFAMPECWQFVTGDDILRGHLLNRMVNVLIKKPPPLAVWVQPLPPPAIETQLRMWMQHEEYCVNGMPKNQKADELLVR